MRSKVFSAFGLVVLFSAALALSCAGSPAPAQAAPTEQAEFALGSEYGERQVIAFEVPVTGKIKARAAWKGKSSGLSLILNGPGKTGYYKRVDGPSALVLTQTVTPEILALGTEWKISIVCWDKDTSVAGVLSVEYPQ